jgi:hypothetical protein
MKKFFTPLIIIVLAAVILTNCKKDEGDPPELPAQESLMIDFSNFVLNTKSAYSVSDQKGIDNTNWVFAATAAGFWRGVLTAVLAIPEATFVKAIDQEPVYLDNKTWQWVYSTTFGSINYKARLTGQIRTSDVQWKMYITKSGDNGFNDFLWYEGTSAHDGSNGQWILNESYESPSPVLQIDWEKDGTSISYVKYTYLKNDPSSGSTIEFGPLTGMYDSYFTIHYYNYNYSRFSDVSIKWNKTTHNGTVQSIDHLGGGWYCWDANRVNLAVCP